MTNPCPYCRNGDIHVVEVMTGYTHNGYYSLLPLKQYQCNSCKEHIEDVKCKLIEHNTSVIMAYVREINKQHSNVVKINDWRK